MRQPFFSIVMPAYNAEKTIETTINSVFKQNWSDFELIIVNDGSKDSTEQIIQKHAQKDPRLKFMTIPNSGPGNARNEGIQKANGQFLYLIDSDDGLPDNTLETYANILKSSTPDLVVSSYELNVMDNDQNVERREIRAENRLIEDNQTFLKELYQLMNQQLMYVIWNKVYRLDIIQEQGIKFPPYSSCEDRLFNIQYYYHVNKVMITSDILYSYSFEGRSSLTNKFLMNKFDTFVEFYVELKKLTHNHLNGTSALFLKGVMSCIIPLHSQGCPLTTKQKFAYIQTILQHTEVKEAVKIASKDSMIRKVMCLLFRSRSKLIIYAASKIMYTISNASPKMIEKLKGSF